MPRKYKRKPGVVPRNIYWTEDSLALAFEELKQNKKGINEISRTYGISARTLRRRYEKSNQQLLTKGKYPILGVENERRLVAHLLKLGDAGFPPDRIVIRQLAYQFAEKLRLKHNFNNESKMAGPQWLKSFLERNPEIALRQAESLSIEKSYRGYYPRTRAKREKKSIEDRMTATESNEPSEMDCQPTALLQDTSKNNENSVDNEGSLQSPSDEKFNDEEIKCEIDTFKNDENSVDSDGSLQSPSDEIFNNEEMECETFKTDENSVDNDGSLQSPSDEIFNYEEIKCEIETFKNDENSVDNDGSLQSPSDEIFNNEEMECEKSKNNENSVDNDGSLQEPSDEIFNQIKKECVTVPQQEETTIDFESDKSLDIPKTQKKSRLREKNKIISQQKKLAVQNKTIATQKRLIAKQVKVINSLKANIEDLELKNKKLTKRNEFLRGSLQRLREKVLNENE